MDKETYKALKTITKALKDRIYYEWGFWNKNSEYWDEIKQIENWIDKIEKEEEIKDNVETYKNMPKM
ncbi:hypothetical protein J4438_03915 [Candidatus Woesearchaeota archaeon]|nr:hypothetical protein [Candidatus Woesearchaeota archaeon]